MPCVVSDEEKAPPRRQVGIRKANVSESLMKCRNVKYMTSKPGCSRSPGMSLAGARLLARWVCHERWSLGSAGGSRGWRCCAVDEGLALRSRPAGGGFKPPHAAPVERRAW